MNEHSVIYQYLRINCLAVTSNEKLFKFVKNFLNKEQIMVKSKVNNLNSSIKHRKYHFLLNIEMKGLNINEIGDNILEELMNEYFISFCPYLLPLVKNDKKLSSIGSTSIKEFQSVKNHTQMTISEHAFIVRMAIKYLSIYHDYKMI